MIYLILAQTRTVGHDEAAGRTGDAGEGLGEREGGGGDHRGSRHPVQQELALALLRFWNKSAFIIALKESRGVHTDIGILVLFEYFYYYLLIMKYC